MTATASMGIDALLRSSRVTTADDKTDAKLYPLAAHSGRDAHVPSENLRREAIARNLCARLCVEARTTDELEQVDALLQIIENGFDPRSLLGRLWNDRYNEDEGSELEQAKRRGFNRGMAHATAIHHLDGCLTELRRQACWPDEEERVG